MGEEIPSGGQSRVGIEGVANLKSSWASLFRSPSSMQLDFTLPMVEGNKVVVVPSEEVLEVRIRMWERSLVGQFVDAKSPYLVIHCLTKCIWGKGRCRILRCWRRAHYLPILSCRVKRLGLCEWSVASWRWFPQTGPCQENSEKIRWGIINKVREEI